MAKERKPTHQPVAGVHGEQNEGGFGFGSLIQFREYAVETETALGVAVAALNSVTLTGIAEHLPIDVILFPLKTI